MSLSRLLFVQRHGIQCQLGRSCAFRPTLAAVVAASAASAAAAIEAAADAAPLLTTPSTVIVGFNGRYNRLYTVTAQCLEDQVPQYSGTIEGILKSFVPPPVA